METRFEDIIDSRKSVRNFSSRKVSFKKLNKIWLDGLKGPSAGGLKSFTINWVTGTKEKNELAKASYNQDFIAEAQVIFVFSALAKECVKHYKTRGKLYAIQDATIACTYAMLSAQAQGLSTCWIGAFDEKKVSKVLKLKKDCKPVALLPIGYKGKRNTKKGKEERGLTTIQQANLSPGWRLFRRMFSCRCKKCGSKACGVTLILPEKKFGFIKRYGKLRFGFMCIKCRKRWVHAYDLSLFDKKISELNKQKRRLKNG